jgi:hypothetical protein
LKPLSPVQIHIFSHLLIKYKNYIRGGMKKLLFTLSASLFISTLCHSETIESVEQIKSTIKSTFNGKYQDSKTKQDFFATFSSNPSCMNGFIKDAGDKRCNTLGEFMSKLLDGTYKKYQKEAEPVQQDQTPNKPGQPNKIRDEVEKRFPST